MNMGVATHIFSYDTRRIADLEYDLMTGALDKSVDGSAHYLRYIKLYQS
jgi:hypothetical protein